MLAERGAGGADQGGCDALLQRRALAPAIRLRPVTPPRVARVGSLPAPRVPAMRRAHRPVLQLVGDSGGFEAVSSSLASESAPNAVTAGASRLWPRLLVLVLVLVTIAAVSALLAFVVLRRESPGAEASSVAPASTTTTMAAVLPAAPAGVAAAPVVHAAEIPVVDVKSLPAAAPVKRARPLR